jgi:hypothetical protein
MGCYEDVSGGGGGGTVTKRWRAGLLERAIESALTNQELVPEQRRSENLLSAEEVCTRPSRKFCIEKSGQIIPTASKQSFIG